MDTEKETPQTPAPMEHPWIQIIDADKEADTIGEIRYSLDEIRI